MDTERRRPPRHVCGICGEPRHNRVTCPSRLRVLAEMEARAAITSAELHGLLRDLEDRVVARVAKLLGQQTVFDGSDLTEGKAE